MSLYSDGRERSSHPLPLSFPGLEAARRRPAATGSDPDCDWYRIADGLLSVTGDDAMFRATVREIYGDCMLGAAAVGALATAGAPKVGCRVGQAERDGATIIDFSGDAPIDLHAFTLGVFADRGYVDAGSGGDEWRFIAHLADPTVAVLAVRGERMVARAGHPWEGLVANVAFSRLMHAQIGCLFFHAGTVSVDGAGMMLCGEKAHGKTTTSLAIALRGHRLLGDEIAAVRVGTRELLPVRRALSLREGPAAGALAARLAGAPQTRLVYPDGGTRTRVAISALLGASVPDAVPLRLIVMIAGFGDRPTIERAVTSRDGRRFLHPLAATMWGPGSPRRAMQLLRLLAVVPAAILRAGTPDDTAAVVEEFCRAS